MSFFFDTRSALAKIEKQDCTPATSATPATQAPKTTPHVAKVADVAAPKGQSGFFELSTELLNKVKARAQSESLPSKGGGGFNTLAPYGRSVTGNPKTWTGKVVSLEQWRQLSEWEKHGSIGKLWNGLTQRWED